MSFYIRTRRQKTHAPLMCLSCKKPLEMGKKYVDKSHKTYHIPCWEEIEHAAK